MGYSLEIERQDGLENVIAYGNLYCISGTWMLLDMTFENAHPLVFLLSFQNDLWSVRDQVFSEAIKYYEANRQPDIFEAIDNLKKAI